MWQIVEVFGIVALLVLAAIFARIATNKIVDATKKETNPDSSMDGCLLSIFGRGLYYFIFLLIIGVLGLLYIIVKFIAGLF